MGTTTSKPQAVFDPEQQELNRTVLGEVQPALRGAGGLPGLTAFRPGAVPGAQEQDILARIMSLAGQPVNPAGSFLSNFAQFAPLYAPQAPRVPTVGAPPDLAGANVPIPGMRTARSIYEPMLADLQGAFESTVAPGVINYLTASGMGRSGAAGEALARAGSQFVAPTIQAAQAYAEGDIGRQQGAQQLQAQMAQQAALTRFGAMRGTAEQQANLQQQAELALLGARAGGVSEAGRVAGGMPLPGAVELSRLPQALQAAAAPRTAQLTEESQMRDLLLSFLFGQPFRSSVAGVGQVQKGVDPVLEMLLGAAGSGAMAFGTAPAGSMMGPALPAAAALSDRRLKSNIRRIGTHSLGIGIYEYDIAGRHDVGVMADEVLRVKPSAVVVGPGGYLMVKYGEL